MTKNSTITAKITPMPSASRSISQSIRNNVPTQDVVPAAPVNVAVNLYVCPEYAGAVSVIEPEATGLKAASHGIPLFSSIPVSVPEVALVDFQEIRNPIVISFPEVSETEYMISGSTVKTHVGAFIRHWVGALAACCAWTASIFAASPKTVAYKVAKTLAFVVSAKLTTGVSKSIPTKTVIALFISPLLAYLAEKVKTNMVLSFI
jgi:hypothetical protein